MGTFAETYDTNHGARTSDESTGLFYVVPIYQVDSDGYYMFDYFLGFEASAGDFAVMDKI